MTADAGITEFALRSACRHFGVLVDEHRKVLIAARAVIQRDRDALAQCHFDFRTGQLDAAGQKGVDEYDAVLSQIAELLPDGYLQEVPDLNDRSLT